MGDKENLYFSLYELSRALLMQQTTEGVLQLIASSLRVHYPEAKTQIYMSQDINHSDVSVQSLAFRNEGSDLRAKALLEGKPMFGPPVGQTQEPEASEYKPVASVVAPIIGRQGVYGVMEVISPDKPLLSEDIELLIRFGQETGAAFENAKLYEQSNLLVAELRIINEMSKRLNQSLHESEIFQYACKELIHVFRADFASIMELDREGESFVVKATNLDQLMDHPFSIHSGLSGILHQTKEPIIVQDYGKEECSESVFMDLTGSLSLIASPILNDGEVVGAVIVTHGESNYFTYDNYRLLRVLADHIGFAMMKVRLHNELERMVITDNLTGLFARRYLDEQLKLLLERDSGGSLIVLDIDNFKQVNDTYGHQVGDQVIKQVSNIVRSCIRDTDIAARWGGEELAIYLPLLTVKQAERVADRIRTRVEQETNPKVTVSCGLSQWSRNDAKISVETLFYRADMALYAAKNNGKNQFHVGS